MTRTTDHNLIIIGGGIAGLSAGLQAARAGLEPVILTGSVPGGHIIRSPNVKNWPGIDSIPGTELISRIRDQVTRAGGRISDHAATALTLQPGNHTITLDAGTTLTSATIILAMGSAPRQLTCPGAAALASNGIYTAVKNPEHYKDTAVLIVGGGATAYTFGLELAKHGAHVTIVNSSRFKTHDPLYTKAQATCALHADYLLHEVARTAPDTLTVTLGTPQGMQTQAYAAIFVALGAQPNTALCAGQLILTPTTGTVFVHPGTSKTSMESVFAAGDLCDSQYRHAITSAGQGCMAALDAIEYLKSKTI